MQLNVILGFINSWLLNFVFKWRSTSSNVNGYEVEALTIPKNIDEPTEKEIKILVDRILTAKKNNPKADTTELEIQIDDMVYEL